MSTVALFIGYAVLIGAGIGLTVAAWMVLLNFVYKRVVNTDDFFHALARYMKEKKEAQ